MSSVVALTEPRPAQRLELLKMARALDRCADIRATFDVEISIRTVFSMSTLEAMANPVAGA